MNCRTVVRYLDPYIDGEIDPSMQIEFERHLAACVECQEQVAFSRSFKAHVREHLSGMQAPAGLRARISSALDDADRKQNEAAVVRLLPLKKRYAVPLAIVAAALMAVTYGAGLNPGETCGVVQQAGALSTLPVFEDVVRVHSSELPSDVRGPSRQDVVSYFRNKVAFPVRPAEFERRDARLVGARLSNVRDRRAAALYYDVGGRRLTVVVFEPTEPLDRGALRTRLLGREVVYQQVQGYTVPVVGQDGLTYAFTGDLDRQSLLRLAASARVRY